MIGYAFIISSGARAVTFGVESNFRCFVRDFVVYFWHFQFFNLIWVDVMAMRMYFGSGTHWFEKFATVMQNVVDSFVSTVPLAAQQQDAVRYLFIISVISSMLTMQRASFVTSTKHWLFGGILLI